jgi:hypothetical protein|tara:strand:- start:1726 stop:2316 length:591 start_codon:yes stop_codon:yes gene_type:complete
MGVQENYRVVKNFLPDDICKVVEQYCLFKMLNEPDVVENESQQCPGTHSVHGDSLTESLLLYAKPKIEDNLGLQLVPTYSYYRVYKPGDILKTHTDRESCEVSATITIGYRYNDKDDEYHWSLYGYVDGEKCYLKCKPGDAVIYKGCELEHGRDRFDVDKYSYQVQVFLHYVVADGPLAKKHKYDGRPGIGHKKLR